MPTAETYALVLPDRADPRGALGLGGKEELGVGTIGSYLTAIDYKTGKIVWKHRYRTTVNTGLGTGLLTTAGGLLFAGDVSGQLRRVRPEERQHPLAHAARRHHHQRAADLHGRRQAICARRRWRRAVRVLALLVTL